MIKLYDLIMSWKLDQNKDLAQFYKSECIYKKIILTGFQLNIQSDLRLSEHLKH